MRLRRLSLVGRSVFSMVSQSQSATYDQDDVGIYCRCMPLLYPNSKTMTKNKRETNIRSFPCSGFIGRRIVEVSYWRTIYARSTPHFVCKRRRFCRNIMHTPLRHPDRAGLGIRRQGWPAMRKQSVVTSNSDETSARDLYPEGCMA